MQFQIENSTVKGSCFSKNLDRFVRFRVVTPFNFLTTKNTLPVLLMNDGQDFDDMQIEKTLNLSFASKDVSPFLYVGIYCNEDRIHEYGTSSTADFKGRGGQALKYSKFIIEEFIPFIKKEFKASNEGKDWIYCGMSLGGLSAFDIVYNHSSYFSKVGVFSGSFWWRKKAYVKNDMLDRSRIVLDMVKSGNYSDHLKFWFQTGTLDEKADRNNNGVIDAIDDTLDLVKELIKKGYSFPGDITYVEVDGGKHDLETWGSVFPDFIRWAFENTKP